MAFKTLGAAALISLALAAPAGASSWGYADRAAEAMEKKWNPQKGYYSSSRFNLTVSMLTVFSAARLAGHEGPARKDERIEPLARSLLSSPTYITTPEELSLANATNPHIPGFTTSFSGEPGYQHVAISAQASEALGMAVKSGALPEELRAEIAAKLGAVAKGRQFTYPKLEANQVNWPMMVWMGYARASGDWSLARGQIRRYMEAWVRGMRRPMAGYLTPNLSPGLGLHYFPESRPSSPANQTASTEYASVIFSGFEMYPELLREGMGRLPAGYEEKMRRWSDRLTTGEWTHSGWPNWDTGLGYERWQLINYFAWCVDGLLALASTDHLSSGPSQNRAAYLIYRALDRFEWLADGRLSGSTRYGVSSDFTRPNDALISHARLGASAALLALKGIERPQGEPGPWGWWDRQKKRLAISSPYYSAAIITPFNRIGYGGLEPARLLDSEGRVLTTLGLTPEQGGLTAYRSGRRIGSTARLSRASTKSWRAQAGRQLSLSGRSGQIQVKTRFLRDRITAHYSLPRGSWGRLRIPLWGNLQQKELIPGDDRLSLNTVNDEGAALSVTVRSSGMPIAEWLTIEPPRMSPRTGQVLLLKGLRDKVTVNYRPQS